jgi:hypothetical protein
MVRSLLTEVKPFLPPELPEITALTGTPVLIDNEEIQTVNLWIYVKILNIINGIVTIVH